MKNNLETKRVTLEQIRELRGNARQTGFKGEIEDRRDNRPYSIHLAIQNPKGRILAGCSFIPAKYENGPAWEVYSVTIHSSFLLDIVGIAYEWTLLDGAMDILFKENPAVRTFWTEVPVSFVWIHEKHGWKKTGEPFKNGDGSLHQKVVKSVSE